MAKISDPLVCIIILNWNGKEIMNNCIESLKKTSYKNYKTIVIDNGSSDKEAVKNLKKLNKDIEIVYLDKNYGYTIGINAGYKYALKKYNPQYICEMNNDIITVQKEWLNIQIKEFEKDKKIGLSNGKLIFPNGDVQALSEKSEQGIFEKDNGQFDYIEEVPYVRGGCLIVSRNLIDKIGYPDENFFYGPNDIDYCYRAKKAGFKVIYNGFAKSIHLGGHSGLAHQKDWIFLPQTEGMLIFYLRYKGLIKGLISSWRFLVRAFITRKNPFAPVKPGNLTFHRTGLKRMLFFFQALFNALRKYKKVKQDTSVKIIPEDKLRLDLE